MIDDNNNSDPFESAAAATLAELNTDLPPESTAAEELADDAQNESIPTRRRGRPRGSGRRRRSGSRSRNSARGSPATSASEPRATTSSQAATTVQASQSQAPQLEPIEPKILLPLLKQIDRAFVRLIGTAPLDEQELREGSEACAPVLDHYAPLFLNQPWAPAVLWAAVAYGPRVVEVYDRRKVGGGRKPATFPATESATDNQDATIQTMVGRA